MNVFFCQDFRLSHIVLQSNQFLIPDGVMTVYNPDDSIYKQTTFEKGKQIADVIYGSESASGDEVGFQ